MGKTIAVVIDDVLNNFGDMLNNMGLTYNSKLHSISDPLLKRCLYDIKNGKLTDIAEKAMGDAALRQSAKMFMNWLNKNGWTIILCTDRDLRFAYKSTIKWLYDNEICYDFLFNAHNLTQFCRNMNIKYLICNRPNIFGISLDLFCFCPAVLETQFKKTKIQLKNYGIYEFHNLEEVRQCIQKN